MKLAARTCEKLVITWNACCVSTMHPPECVLGNHYLYQRLKRDVLIAWNPESREPANVWWQRLRLRNAPVINGDIILLRQYDAFTIYEFHQIGWELFGNINASHFLDYVQIQDDEWLR